MSNLWAVLAAGDGYYHFDVNGGTQKVNAANERMFDRWAMRYPFCPVAQDAGFGESGVLWVSTKGVRVLDGIRRFFKPPTVLFTKGSRGTALWAIPPTRLSLVLDANERLARLFKGRLMDASPLVARLDLAGCQAEWRLDAYYDDFEDLVVRL
jgi:hypothetical protein